MLSLKASIEAARAGERGRGFEVVAKQIRTLSDKTKKLIDENNLPQIESLVNSIEAMA